jgi:undecaprenyl-diphosphatase
MVNAFDQQIVSFFNQYAHRSLAFDEFVTLVSDNYVLKTGVITVLLYWAWFKETDHPDEHRATVIFGLVASCAAVLLVRLLTLTLPFRERPLRNPDLHFVLPYSIKPSALLGWSSFPSDNAVLFFGVSTCLWLISRRVGLVAFCHTCLIITLPRIYRGFHYPTDILAGALIGVGAVALIKVPGLKAAVTRRPMAWLQRHPAAFQAALCFLILLIAQTFYPFYSMAAYLIELAQETAAP